MSAAYAELMPPASIADASTHPNRAFMGSSPYQPIEPAWTLICPIAARDTGLVFPEPWSPVCGQVLPSCNERQHGIPPLRSAPFSRSPAETSAISSPLATGSAATRSVIAAVCGPEGLDLGHAAVAVSQLHRHELGCRRKLLV